MKYLKDLCKLAVLLGLFGAVIYGLFHLAKEQAPANRKRYQHPIYRTGGHW